MLNKAFYESLKSRSWRAPHVCSPIYDLFRPKKVIEAGCGCGDLLAWFHNHGCDIRGIEVSPECVDVLMFPLKYLILQDLTKGSAPYESGDIAMCFLVGEYIPPEQDSAFVHNLCQLSNRIIFASTEINAWGGRIVNCKPSIEWEKQFHDEGFKRCDFAERWLRHKWAPYGDKPIIKMMRDNLLVVVKK